MSVEKQCPVCMQDGMSVFVEIEDVPVHCNIFWSSEEAALNAPKGDIRLSFCQVCGMIYNLSFDPSRMQYTQEYENSLHFSPRFQAYAQGLATRLTEKYDLNGKDIIEVGCGKGEFLSMLCEGGRNRGVGFDAGYDASREGEREASHLTFIRDFYSEHYAQYRADLICCRQVLEHIQSPRDFMSELQRTIRDRRETVIFFEVPNVLYTLRDLGIWDIIYEHCSYFSAASLARVFAETDFESLQLYEEYGGQFLCIEAAPANGLSHPPTEQGENVREISDLVSAFAQSYRMKVETWKSNLRDLVGSGKRAVVWGAGSKGVTFLNALRVTDQIGYVVDINPHKQWMYVAGGGQRIVPPSFLQEYRPDVVIVMNPIYCDEVRHITKSMSVAADLIVA